MRKPFIPEMAIVSMPQILIPKRISENFAWASPLAQFWLPPGTGYDLTPNQLIGYTYNQHCMTQEKREKTTTHPMFKVTKPELSMKHSRRGIGCYWLS